MGGPPLPNLQFALGIVHTAGRSALLRSRPGPLPLAAGEGVASTAGRDAPSQPSSSSIGGSGEAEQREVLEGEVVDVDGASAWEGEAGGFKGASLACRRLADLPPARPVTEQASVVEKPTHGTHNPHVCLWCRPHAEVSDFEEPPDSLNQAAAGGFGLLGLAYAFAVSVAAHGVPTLSSH